MPCVFWDACTFAVGRDSPESRGSKNSLLALGLAPAISSDPTPCDDEMRQGWLRCEVLRSKSDFHGRCAARVAVSWLSVMEETGGAHSTSRACRPRGFLASWTLEEPWL